MSTMVYVTRPELLAVSSYDDENGRAHLTLQGDAENTYLNISGTRAEMRALAVRIRRALGEQPSGGLREGYTHGPYWLEKQQDGSFWILGWDPDTENWPGLVASVECEEDAAMILDRLGYRRTTIPVQHTGIETPCPVCKYPVRVHRSAGDLQIEPTCECLGSNLVDAVGYTEAVEQQVSGDGRLVA